MVSNRSPFTCTLYHLNINMSNFRFWPILPIEASSITPLNSSTMLCASAWSAGMGTYQPSFGFMENERPTNSQKLASVPVVSVSKQKLFCCLRISMSSARVSTVSAKWYWCGTLSIFFAAICISGSAISAISTVMVVRPVATGSPKRSVWMPTDFISVMLKSSPNTRLPKVRNSSSAKSGSSRSLLGAHISSPASSSSTGTFRLMVANLFDMRPCSLNCSIFSRCLPFSSWLWAKIFSMEPYCLMSSLAVFSPIPGIPGIPSAASPQRPRMSITCSTCSISHLAQTSFTPKISISLPIRAGLYIFIFSDTSCAKSLSGVMQYTS